MAVSHYPPLVVRLRRLSLAILAAGPLGCLGIFLPLVWPNLELSDLWTNPSGSFGFLFLLIGPYVLATLTTLWLGKTLIRAWVAATGALILSAFGIVLWYDLFVLDKSPLAFLALISVHWLQLFEVGVFSAVNLVIWAVERGIGKNRPVDR